MKKKLTKCLFLTWSIVGIFFLTGCSGAKTAERRQDQKSGVSEREREHVHDRALRHFIDGTGLEAKGSYAEAILEYQEALQAEPNAAIYYAISRDYALLEKYSRAAEAAREAVRLEPRNIPYRENLAAIYLNTFQQDHAIREYEHIVEIDSEYAPGWFALARLYQPTRPLKALEIYEKLLDRDGGQWDVLLQCATLYSALGRFDSAAAKYREMLEIDPSNKQLQRQLAETYAKSGKLNDAADILESMVETDSSNAETLTALANVYLDQKEYKKSINIFENLLKRGIKDPEIKLRIGVGFFGLTEHDSTLVPRAKGIFEEVQKDMPNDWRPYWYLGALASNQRDDSLAGDYFERVTQLAPWNADAWWFLGSSLFGRGKYDQVLEVAGRAEHAVPKDFRGYLLEGLAYTRLDKQEDALKALEKAYELNPKDLNTLSTLALTYDNLHRYKDSDRIYEEALKIDPKSALLLNNYGYSLAERGVQLQRALEMAKQAVAAEPENAAYLDTYGWVFYRLEKYEDAATYIEKAIATGKASAVVQEHLGDIYLKLGQREKALMQWKKALEMDPKNESAKEKIQAEAK
jgi:tetratricopeptide (TPR) repeat protein